jgi:anti-sigma factor RsiW
MTDQPCPHDAQLLRLAADDYGERDFLLHVESCPACQKRLATLRHEISRLRRAVRGALFSPPPHRNGSEPTDR